MPARTRVAALVVRNDEILLVLHEKGGKEYYLLPGGGVEEGEADLHALERELREETGMVVTPLSLLFETKTVAPGARRTVIQRVYHCRAQGKIRPSGDPRVKRAEFIPIKTLPKLTFYPNLKREILDAWRRDFEIEPRTFGVAWED